MKDLMTRVILFLILGFFIYRNRNLLLKLVLVIETLRYLGTSLNFKWIDMKDLMKYKHKGNEFDT